MPEKVALLYEKLVIRNRQRFWGEIRGHNKIMRLAEPRQKAGLRVDYDAHRLRQNIIPERSGTNNPLFS
jgi:hypothetical protein